MWLLDFMVSHVACINENVYKIFLITVTDCLDIFLVCLVFWGFSVGFFGWFFFSHLH